MPEVLSFYNIPTLLERMFMVHGENCDLYDRTSDLRLIPKSFLPRLSTVKETIQNRVLLHKCATLYKPAIGPVYHWRNQDSVDSLTTHPTNSWRISTKLYPKNGLECGLDFYKLVKLPKHIRQPSHCDNSFKNFIIPFITH